MNFRISYEFVEKGLQFEDILIKADNMADARVLAKYRVEKGTDEAFRVKAVVLEQESSRLRLLAGGLD